VTKRVQIVGHDAEGANAFIGLERELTADVENDELRLHDGTTPGGHRILNRDQGDARWQGKSPELSGFLGWEPDERGILVRLGPANYKLREFEVDENQLVLENPNGFSGNPKLGLADTISTNHTFSGEITFSESIAAEGGVVGNLTGDSVGNHVGNVTGNVTGNVVGNANGNHTGSFVGDVDTSGHTMVMASGQILLSWLSQAILDYIIKAGLPVGSIVAFSGDLETVDDNWAICDGTNGTPDLRGRFIIGTSGTYAADSTGGNATHSHTITIENGGAHTHTGEVEDHTLTVSEIPGHYHANGVTDQNPDKVFSRGYVAAATTTTDSIDDNSDNGIYEGITSTVGGGGAHSHGLNIESGGSHTHTGAAASSSNLPPYYSLVYIMKVA
jgi:cytoskeletal protein CcmA (bactofilin family)